MTSAIATDDKFEHLSNLVMAGFHYNFFAIRQSADVDARQSDDTQVTRFKLCVGLLSADSHLFNFLGNLQACLKGAEQTLGPAY